MNIKEKIKQLKELAKDLPQGLETPIAAIFWLPEDLRFVEDSDMSPLTEDDIADIISTIESEHDASIGINYDVIRYHVSNVQEDKDPIEELIDEAKSVQ